MIILERDMLVISSLRKIFIFSFPTKNLTFNQKNMKKKSVITKFLMAQLLLWGVFSLILSSTPVSFQNVTRTSESLNLKSSAADFSNATVISDGFGDNYWNDDSSYNPAIAVDSSNTVHVVWQDYTDGPWGTDNEILYANYTIATGWSNATVISDGFGGVYWNDGFSYDHTVAVDSSNTVHVVWEENTDGPWGTDSEVMYTVYTTGWSNVTLLSDGQNSIYWNDGSSNSPAIVVDGNDVIHVVWEDSTDGGWGTDYEIMYTEFINATGWSLPLVISDGYDGDYWNDGVSYTARIAAGTTKVHIVWEDATNGKWGTDYEIMHTSIPIPAPPAPDVDSPKSIPFGSFYMLFILVGILGIIIYIKRKL